MTQLSPPRNRSADAEATDTDLRAWRRRRTRRRLLLRAGVPLLALLLIAVGIWVVGFSSAFVIRSVQVTGNDDLSDEQVLSVAAVPMGVALARVDREAIAERIQTIEQVESAEVHRQWPDRLGLVVTERTPLYAIPLPSGGAMLVDRHGVGYLRVPQDRPKENGERLPHAKVNPDSERLLRSVAGVVSALPEKVQKKVKYIEATDPDAIEFQLRGGDTVFWGSAEQTELKATVLVALLKRDGTHYDVSAPGNPAVR